MSTPPLFCAASLDELRDGCASALSCQSGPCPKGTFCFPYPDCDEGAPPEFTAGGGMPTYAPTTATWPLTTAEQYQSMGTYAPTEASGDGGGGVDGDSTGSPSARPQQQQHNEEEQQQEEEEQQQEEQQEGEQQQQQQEVEQQQEQQQQPQQADESLCPGQHTGWRAANGCRDYYSCLAGVPGPVRTCQSGLRFDVADRRCRVASQVDGGTCEGSSPPPPTSSQPQQAPSQPQQGQTAQEPQESQVGGGKPDETTAQQHQQQEHGRPGPSMCPNADGWHTTKSCTEYYQCADGLPDKIYTCPPGTLFDVLRTACETASGVDASACRGPPLRPDEAEHHCPEGYTGLKIQGSCTEYYECRDGSAMAVRTCGPGLKYDRNSHRCIDADVVDGQCFGPDIRSPQTAADLCPIRDGWVAHSGCAAYHECADGLPDRIYTCRDPERYDRVRNECNALGVDGDCRGPPVTEDEAREQARADAARLCPIRDGWVAHTGCESYHECRGGTPGTVYGCRGPERYDRVRNRCTDLGVDDNCRGPPLTESEKRQQQQQQQGGQQTPGGGGRPSAAPPCPPSLEGYGTGPGCRSYYTCSAGSMTSASRTCPDGTRFDKTTRRCRAKSSVNDHCYGPPEGSPDERAGEVCASDVDGDGWRTLDGCRRYFMCQSGRLVDAVHECGADLLFDETRGMCNFADADGAACSSGAAGGGPDGDGGGRGVPPLGAGGGGGNPWADVLAPSPGPTAAPPAGTGGGRGPGKIPPWMRLEFSGVAAGRRPDPAAASLASLVVLAVALLR